MKKRYYRAISLLIVVLIIGIFTAHVAAANVIDDARQSVVRVWVPGAGTGTGTGWIVAQSGTSTILVTNLHVISGGGTVYIIPSDISGAWIEAQVTYLQDGLDLAILTTAVGLSGRPALPLASAKNVRAAETVYALGFPGAADEIIDYGDWLPSSPDDVTVTRGIVSSAVAVRNNTDAIQHDCFIYYGNSGGPLLNEAGEVIGVNTWINPDAPGGVNYAIHIDYVMEALDDFGILYSIPDAASIPEPPSQPPAQSPSGTSELDTTQPPSQPPPPSPDAAGNFFSANWWIILCVAAGAAIGLYINSRRKKPAAAPQPMPAAVIQPAAHTPVASSASFHLICTKGNFAGTTFPINGSLSIGRDPKRCQIVFPNDAKGISSLHCTLKQQGSSVIATDMGSTYGTFVNGRKLNPNENVTLNSGDSLRIADEKNEFKVL